MEFETTETVRSTPSRHEKSLGLLTMKFVSLLQEAKDGVLDLKVVSETGSVALFVGCIFVVVKVGSATFQTAAVNKGLVSHRRSGALICLTGGRAKPPLPGPPRLLCGFSHTKAEKNMN